MTLREQIAAYEARRASAVAVMTAIMDKSAEVGETLDAAQQEEFDTAKKDVEAIDAQLKRLSDMEAVSKATAKPVVAGSEIDGAQSREPARGVVQIKGDNVPKGIRYARWSAPSIWRSSTRRTRPMSPRALARYPGSRDRPPFGGRGGDHLRLHQRRSPGGPAEHRLGIRRTT
jgi:hypothetical protein